MLENVSHVSNEDNRDAQCGMQIAFRLDESMIRTVSDTNEHQQDHQVAQRVLSWRKKASRVIPQVLGEYVL